MKPNKKQAKPDLLLQLKNIALVIAGTLVLAFGCAIFVEPFHLVTGGVTGLSIALDGLVDVPDATIPIIGNMPFIDILVFVITWSLFFLGLIFLGKDFEISAKKIEIDKF